MGTRFILLCTLIYIVDSASTKTSLAVREIVEDVTGTPSPLDLLYQAVDDDLNAISFDKHPSLQGDSQNGYDKNPAQSDESSTTAVETTRSMDSLGVTPKSASTATESSSIVATLTTTSIPQESSHSRSTTASRLTSTERLGTMSTISKNGVFLSTKHSTRQPQDHAHQDDDSSEVETTSIVDIKKKPANSKKKKPLRPSVWDTEDETIEKDIITKIVHGALRNHERMRNRNLRRLLRRFQVLAFRADLSADEFHRFMRLVSEYTPSRIPTFLLRKSERRQFQEANRVRWQHIRDQMLGQAKENARAEVVEMFLKMVERDGALRNRFGKPRRTHMNLEEFLRRQAPLMRRLLVPSHIDYHPLIREILGGKIPPSPFFTRCCDF
ncbi:uncharacterized protein LOC111247500 isoform X1 [Varroa destructor]|uniref:Uncharacterized protein n=1 Tax=Varroa destructor TaxID=109461 RepID=A0A7M7JPB2_VARDE|nr:uncharacterized protein LOC111247500 isoform X1 [Varroa destructor]